VTRELIDALLLQQDTEFSTDFGHVNHLLASTISETPQAELLAAGRELIASDAARRRILGTRLLRELGEHAGQAVAELTWLLDRELDRENDDEVLYWVVSALGFLGGAPVTAGLTGLAAHGDPGIRYHVATALANAGTGELPEESRATLISLAQDPNAEVRFSAVFELGAWWQAAPDARVEAVLRRACRDSDRATAQAARSALGEDQN
jgi:hypothetical protein